MPTKNNTWMSGNETESLWDFLININDEEIQRYKDLGFDLVFEYDESTRRIQPKFRDHKKSDIDQFLANELDDIEKVFSTYDANGILNTAFDSECFNFIVLLLDSGIKIEAVDPSTNENILHYIFAHELEKRYFVEEMWGSISNLISAVRAKIGDDAFFNALHVKSNQDKSPLDLSKSNGYGVVSGSVGYLENFISEYSLKK